MTRHRYTVLLDADPHGAGFSVTVPALRGCITEGASFEEAVDNARGAISGFIETLEQLGEFIPREVPGLIAVAVEVEARTIAEPLSA